MPGIRTILHPVSSPDHPRECSTKRGPMRKVLRLIEPSDGTAGVDERQANLDPGGAGPFHLVLGVSRIEHAAQIAAWTGHRSAYARISTRYPSRELCW